MALLNLLGGSYVARSVIADAQRCVNLYPEINPKDAEVPVTHFPTPGLTLLKAGPIQSPWRGLYFANNDQLYGVLGTNVYKIDAAFGLTLLGTIPSKVTPISMVDNGTTLVLVDGSSQGWQITLSSGAFAQITDPNFFGGDYVWYTDTFFVFNLPGTKTVYASQSNSLVFNPLSLANKTGSADTLIAIIVVHLEIWLIGEKTTEIWYNAGGSPFPFQRIPGVFIQHGCVAKYSVATYNLQVFWISQDNNGQVIVLEGSNYQVKVISTPAVADAMRKYLTISDAKGFVYQQGTHVFYVLNFPTANKTWVYDASVGLWHERAYNDQNGVENRISANCTAFAYGMNIVGDWQNGNLYELDLDSYTDNGAAIVRRRGFPHIVNDGKMAFHVQFIANMEVGTIAAGASIPTDPVQNPDPDAAQQTPLITLRWSDDRGKSFGNGVTISMGSEGETFTRPSWRDLGQSFDRVYELSWSENCAAALNGAYLDAIPLAV